jgi:hypothetical protein
MRPNLIFCGIGPYAQPFLQTRAGVISLIVCAQSFLVRLRDMLGEWAYARGARHFALASARSFAHLFQFGMLRLVLGFTQVFFVSFVMSRSGCRCEVPTLPTGARLGKWDSE